MSYVTVMLSGSVTRLPGGSSFALSARRGSRTAFRSPRSGSSSKRVGAVGASASSVAFKKYQGLGNDFIIIDNRASQDPVLTPEQVGSPTCHLPRIVSSKAFQHRFGISCHYIASCFGGKWLDS